MTTIAYRHGELAGDTMITEGDTIVSRRTRKVFKLRDGRLFASSGNSEGGDILLKSLREGKDSPNINGICALLVGTDGNVYVYEGKLWVRHSSDYYAIGNGASYAMGAMAHGATAKEAVKIGIRLDTHSGGRVQVVKLGVNEEQRTDK